MDFNFPESEQGDSSQDRNGLGQFLRDGLETMLSKPEVCMVTRCGHCQQKIEVVDFKDISCPACGQEYWG